MRVRTLTGPAGVEAVRHLRRVDPVLARVIDSVGPFRFARRKEGTHFDAVVRSIVYQQLSGKAAATIHRRLCEVCGRTPTPQDLLRTNARKLRGAGLSRQKLGYLRDLAARVSGGEVPLDSLDALGDDAVVEALVRVKGVGVWTAHMFLMFRLGRPDVLPIGDLGIQSAVRRAYGMRARPSPDRIARIGAAWAPWRTVASWYLWRSLD